jgi:hypothetical protein
VKSVFAGNVDADSAITAAVELYGAEATTAVAYCALEAYLDRRGADHDFWFRIFAHLRGIPLSDSKH